MALIERLLAQANKESNELADILLDSVDELSRLYKIESEWAALSQDDGKAGREIERLKATPAPDLVAVVSGYYGGQCVVLPIDPSKVFNAGTAFYTIPPASRPADVHEPALVAAARKVIDEFGTSSDGLQDLYQALKPHIAPPAARSAPDCTRSHPHENMDAMCELRTEIARLTNENARLKAIAAPVQEIVAWQYRDANDDGTWSAWLGCDKRLTESTWREIRPLYTTPPAAQVKKARSATAPEAPVVQNICSECANADSWGLPDKPTCRSCISNSEWSPLNRSSINPITPPAAQHQPLTDAQPVQEPVGYEHHEYRSFGAPGEVRISAILKSRYKLPNGSTSGDYQWIIDQCRASKDTIKLIPLYTTPQAAQASNGIVSKPN